MSIANLGFQQFSDLLHSVFGLQDHERALTFFVDLPDVRTPDTPGWKDRRRIAAEWFTQVFAQAHKLPFSSIQFCTYPNVGANNGDLPDTVVLTDTTSRAASAHAPQDVSLREVLEGSSVVLAMTEFSATAPLKILARQLPFRGATLPGFTREMIPALGLDYEKVNARVLQFTGRLTRADAATIDFIVAGKHYLLEIDLRYRSAHASGGQMREPGTVANLPSGEAYIVPYEGERGGEPTRTRGLLPVQFRDEVVVFRVVGNRAVGVLSTGKESDAQRVLLHDDPAYGNIAELGIGVLGEWGVGAVGSTLLDEKLGIHIAFGRSDHFGGVTSPASFRNPSNVVHIDWVYVPSIQPMILVENLLLGYPGGTTESIVSNGRYVI